MIAGRQLAGINLVALQVSDIRLALSLLTAWDGVAPDRLGMCGLSQGGRMTTYTSVMDERVRVAVASGACNTFRDRVALRQGACGAQILPGLLPAADTFDLFAAMAPRALQLQWGTRDPLIVQEYSKPEAEHLRACYNTAEEPNRLDIDVFDGAHEFHFEPALEWFRKWL